MSVGVPLFRGNIIKMASDWKRRFRLYMKYLGFFLGTIVLILLANFTVNYFVSLSTVPFIKIVGDTNTWILFNSGVIGSIVGGLVAGIIAFNVSKQQIDKENENNLYYRKLELKYSLQVEVTRKILDIVDVLLTQHYLEAKYINNIYEQIGEHRKYSRNKDDIKNSDAILSQMKDYCRLNYNALFEETVKDFDYQFKLNHIYSCYTIIILEHKSSFEHILNKLLLLKDIKTKIKEYCEKLTKIVEIGDDIEDIDYSNLRNLVGEFRNKVNLLIFDLTCFNVDIQNSLGFLFNDKVEKPEYSERV
jgi:hypothetical protein